MPTGFERNHYVLVSMYLVPSMFLTNFTTFRMSLEEL